MRQTRRIAVLLTPKRRRERVPRNLIGRFAYQHRVPRQNEETVNRHDHIRPVQRQVDQHENYLRLYSQREQLKCTSVVHLTYAYALQRAQLTLRAVWLEADLVFFPAPLPSPFAPPFPLAPPLACPPSESAPIFDPFADADSDCPPAGVCPF